MKYERTIKVRDWKHATELLGEPSTMLVEVLRNNSKFPDGKLKPGDTINIRIEVSEGIQNDIIVEEPEEHLFFDHIRELVKSLKSLKFKEKL